MSLSPTPSAGAATGRVLVVDDEKSDRLVLRAILRRGGYEVREADNGDAALAAMRAQAPDLVLLDVRMPGKDGYAVCAELKADPALADIPVIFLSARDSPTDKVRGFELGANDYVAKPFAPEEVLARVRTQFRLQHLTRSLQELNTELLARQTRLEEDLRAAAHIQRALLPRAHHPLPGLDAAWRFVPCGDVGGDLLNLHHLHRLGPSYVAAYMLDVSGHGVPSAMVAVSVERLLSPDGGVIFRERPLPPLEVLRELEHNFPFERFERFFTLSYLLRYSSAGHPPPVLLPREGPLRPLTEGGPPLGLGLGIEPTEGEVQLSRGDRLFLYTDGLYETEDAQGTALGLERLHAFFLATRELSLDAACDAVLQRVREHHGERPAEDDITLLALEYLGPTAC